MKKKFIKLLIIVCCLIFPINCLALQVYPGNNVVKEEESALINQEDIHKFLNNITWKREFYFIFATQAYLDKYNLGEMEGESPLIYTRSHSRKGLQNAVKYKGISEKEIENEELIVEEGIENLIAGDPTPFDPTLKFSPAFSPNRIPTIDPIIGPIIDPIIPPIIDPIPSPVPEPTPAPVPEPATIILVGLGLVGMAGFQQRKIKNKKEV